MSNQNSSSFSSSSFSFSSSSTINGQESGQRSTREVRSGPDGTTVSTSSQRMGEAAVNETRRYDSEGRERLEGNESEGQRKIEDVSDEQQASNDKLYEERMEDEYAKREGGA